MKEGKIVSEREQSSDTPKNVPEFNAKPRPEAKEGYIEKTTKTERGGILDDVIHQKGDPSLETYRREVRYRKDENTPAEIPDSDWQRFTTRDEQGRPAEVISQSFLSKGETTNNQTKESYSYDESGKTSVRGKIESGESAGHEWLKTTEEKDLGEGRTVSIEINEIIEQGNNPQKPEKGAIFEKRTFKENGAWAGNENINRKTEEITYTLPKDAKELPEWAKI